MIYINLIMILSIISISSSNIMSMWYYMEIASFSFMFYLMKNKNSMASCVIYFIISFIATLLILSSFIHMNTNSMEINLSILETSEKSNFLPLAFFLKMGVIPLHSWVFKMTKNMDWNSIIILFSIQKLIPIWMIMSFSKSMISFLFIVVNSMMAPFIPMKSKNAFFLISTSSVINNIWIILSSLTSSMVTVIFSLSYFFMNSNLIMIMKKSMSKKNMNSNSIQSMIAMLSLMGFPPLPNFFIKLLILKNIMNMFTSMIMFSVIILISNMISTIMYTKFILMNVINYKKLMSMNMMKKNSHILNNLSVMSPLLFSSIFLFN